MDIIDIDNPDRGFCIIDGCNNLQRNHGHKVWGKYCDKHHNSPVFKKIRSFDREASKQACQGAKLAEQFAHKKMKAASKLLPGICVDCGIKKPVVEYPKGRSVCKLCVKKDGRNRTIESKYGINRDTYDRIYATQNGCCAICGEKHDKLDIDHCHTEGHVRGLLCHKCNLGIGLFQDDLDLLASASSYLINSRLKIVVAFPMENTNYG